MKLIKWLTCKKDKTITGKPITPLEYLTNKIKKEKNALIIIKQTGELEIIKPYYTQF